MLKLKLLLDENIGSQVADALSGQGYNVKSVFVDMRGATDEKVLEAAVREERVVVTLEKDFGQLVFHSSKQHVGVLFLRLRIESTENIIHVLLDVLDGYGGKLQGKFTTATEYSIRIR
jgi:predicted nuclease of predicted toxin-antitoxin system